MRFALKKLAFAGLLACMGSSSFAVTYFYVQPKSMEMSKVSPLSVALSQSVLPTAVVGQPYNGGAGFDFKSVLAVSGDSGFNAALASFSIPVGTLPEGLMVSGAGVLAGTPTTPTTGASFTAQATYKLQHGQQNYTVVVNAAPTPVGDGISKAGACASGAATGCATWTPAGLDPSVTLSGSPILSAAFGACHGTLACNVMATKAPNSGKWYWEITLTQHSTGHGGLLFGVASPSQRIGDLGSVYYYAYAVDGWAYNASGAQLAIPVHAPTNGDTFGFAMDLNSSTINVTRNGAPLFSSALATGATFTPKVGEDWYTANAVKANFGQANFAYPVPAGFNAGLW